MVFLVLTFLGLALLFTVLALPLLARRVEPNRFYGLRTRESFRSTKIWYEINAYSARLLLMGSVAFAVFVIVLAAFGGLDPSAFAIACTIGLVSYLLAVFWLSMRRLLRMSAQSARE